MKLDREIVLALEPRLQDRAATRGQTGEGAAQGGGIDVGSPTGDAAAAAARDTWLEDELAPGPVGPVPDGRFDLRDGVVGFPKRGRLEQRDAAAKGAWQQAFALRYPERERLVVNVGDDVGRGPCVGAHTSTRSPCTCTVQFIGSIVA